MLEPVVSSQPPTQRQADTLTKYVNIFNSDEEELLRRKTIHKLLKMDRRLRLLLLPVTLATLYLFTSSLSLLSRYPHSQTLQKSNFRLESCLISRSFRLLSSHLDQDELLASAKMTSPVIGLAIGILATSLLQVSYLYLSIGLTSLHCRLCRWL